MKISRMVVVFFFLFRLFVPGRERVGSFSIMWIVFNVIRTKHKHVLVSAINFLGKSFLIARKCAYARMLLGFLMSFFSVFVIFFYFVYVFHSFLRQLNVNFTSANAPERHYKRTD